ncbi:MAG: MltA domain-containing protein [Bdellovibrionales bacterium]|nr:MltA domain-containing protein [Bdellovibrionales bacterium]
MKCLVILFLSVFVLSCARSPLKSPEEALRKHKSSLEIQDDLSMESLVEVLKIHVEHLNKNPERIMSFGPVDIKNSDYAKSLEILITEITSQEQPNLSQIIKEYFQAYEVYGDKRWGDVYVTGYYEPVIEGRLKPESPFLQPLYEYPKDLVIIDLNKYFDSYLSTNEDSWSRQKTLRGRLFESSNGRKYVVPYYDRQEIDELNHLKESAKIIAYVKPADAFFLQIQGSGAIDLGSKEIQVGYAGQNGHPYVPVGKFLFDIIPKEKMSMQAIYQHLQSLSPEEAQALMNKNPSYVFFQTLDSRPLTFMGTPVVDGRTIATDFRIFPKGALAFLKYPKPLIVENGEEEVSYIESSRLVVDQDTGGAIRGPGRVDLFWGRGYEAGEVAGRLKGRGKLYYFVPKQKTLELINIQP